MQFLCQYDYRHIPYETNVDNGGNPENKRTIASSGCGLCSICMAVELLTTQTLGVEECRDLSYQTGANRPHAGTNLDMLCPTVAERFNLKYTPSEDIQEAIACLQAGGKIIAHVKKGLFTNGGHYICLVSTDGKDICILDPSYTPEKFHTPEREGRVDDTHAPFVYCPANVLHDETKDGRTKYHMLERKR